MTNSFTYGTEYIHFYFRRPFGPYKSNGNSGTKQKFALIVERTVLAVKNPDLKPGSLTKDTPLKFEWECSYAFSRILLLS